MKEQLFSELKTAIEILKDKVKFKDLMSDGPEGDLARLFKTLMQILSLLEMNEIKDIAQPENKAIQDGLFRKSGSLVKIRPCGEEYKDKTYLGFYIGDIALGSSIKVKEDKIQLNFSGHNPAIFVPEIGKIIYGCESWWGEIEDEKDLKDITDSDIENVWYVKLLKFMPESKGKTDESQKESESH